MTAGTPAQAAYEASTGILRDDLDGTPWAWDTLPQLHREAWEAAAKAALEAAGRDTGLRLWQGENWAVPADVKPDQLDEDLLVPCRAALVQGQPVPAATLRRVGWLDQKGRVYVSVPPSRDFDGGSLTPLLIDAREDGH